MRTEIQGESDLADEMVKFLDEASTHLATVREDLRFGGDLDAALRELESTCGALVIGGLGFSRLLAAMRGQGVLQ